MFPSPNALGDVTIGVRYSDPEGDVVSQSYAIELSWGGQSFGPYPVSGEQCG